MPEKNLADRLREVIRLCSYSYRTEKAYATPPLWAHHLAVHEQVSASTQN